MKDLLNQIAMVIERGKVDQSASYPPDLKGQPGASDLTKSALDQDIDPNTILNEGLMRGMQNIGQKFGRGEVFIPDVLIAAKAMNAAMEHLRPFFESGEAQRKGTMIIGTVTGDLHDIGKNLVRMMMEGNGWEVIDLGVDVSADGFLQALEKHPHSIVGLSALLTTTMVNMEDINQSIKNKFDRVPVYIGGAPVTQSFSDQIGADAYFKDPQSLIHFLNESKN
ncbi:MAG: cobalamin-binding protein [Caldithrix sp.]|nr:cobalamin-binding protein [Caldithrix sp.]